MGVRRVDLPGGGQVVAVDELDATPGRRFLWPRQVLPIDIANGATVIWAPDGARLVLAGRVGRVNEHLDRRP